LKELGLLKPIKKLARRFIESRGFVRGAAAADLDAVMLRRRDVSVETVIDVGASDGHWSARMMRYFPNAKYLLIEAQEAAHSAALHRFKTARANVDYELCAAGDREGEIYFDASDSMGGLASATPFPKNNISVPVSTIDALVRHRNLRGPFLLKLDTHGYEVPILEGARQTMAQSAMLIIEAYNFTLCPGALRFYELCQFLEPRGFRCGDMFDLMNRPGDHAFWQIDMVFLPSTHPVFRSNLYISETQTKISQ
jgi:FkbM family methyltransferase